MTKIFNASLQLVGLICVAVILLVPIVFLGVLNSERLMDTAPKWAAVYIVAMFMLVFVVPFIRTRERQSIRQRAFRGAEDRWEMLSGCFYWEKPKEIKHLDVSAH